MLKFRPTPWRTICAAVFAVGAMMMTAGAEAQISRDGTAGQTAGDLPNVNGVFEIDGADGIRAGANDQIVVHSMDQFNLANGETARYMDSDSALQASVLSILTRVTGGSGSVLNGRIESLYPNADLFFVNPNGVFFGANFTIDVPKSFHSSTADVLDFESGISIDTTAPVDIPTLTSAVPMAWRFLGAGPEKRIDVDGFTVDDSFTVTQGNEFTFVGSNLAFGSSATPINMNTNGRTVVAIALGDSGTVDGVFGFSSINSGAADRIIVTPTNETVAGFLDFNGQIDTSGDQFLTGEIGFWGGETQVTGTLSTAATSQLPQRAGEIILRTTNLSIDGLLDASSVSDFGGGINLTATESINLGNSVTTLRTSAIEDGMESGPITIFAPNGRVTGTGVLFDLGANTNARVSDLTITTDIIDLQNLVVRASATGAGFAGDVFLSGRQILLSGVGPNSIDTSNSGAFGGGGVFIAGSEFVDFRSMTINTSSTNGGNGGDVGIFVPQATSDANFSIDQSAQAPANSGITSGTVPVVTANPPAIDPGPNTGIFRDDTPGQQEALLTAIADVYEINGNDGLRRVIDGEEFVIHSFERFNLESFETARFTDDVSFLASVDAVFARITGTRPSRIEGTIENAYNFADLTFVNSNGVIFADGFTLDTNASFTVSTADSIDFASGLTIDLTTASAIPDTLALDFATRWNFLSAGPEKEIQIDGFAVVDNGPLGPDATLQFLGADVTFNMQGPLQTQGRNLLAVAVGTSGGFDVEPLLTRAGLGNTPNGNLTLNLLADGVVNSTGTDGGASGGGIFLLGGSVGVTLGTGSTLSTGRGTTQQTIDSGALVVVADDFEILGQGTTVISTEAAGIQGSVSIDVANSIDFGTDTRFFGRALFGGQDASDVSIVAALGELSGGLSVFSSASTGANGGNVAISADVINLTDFRAQTSAGTGSVGGDISIIGRQITLDGSLFIEGTGQSSISSSVANGISGGNILINASESLAVQELTINASSSGLIAGNGGNVEINSPIASADAMFDVNVSSALGSPGLFSGTAFPTAPTSRIIRDATSAINAGPITPIAGVYEINGADGFRRGPNDSIVVHSFSEFGLDSTETALFTDTPGFLTNVTTVLSRVTGGQASQIDGTIESLYSNAGLFFVNPNGMIFGTDFALDTFGAFYASTADSILWDANVSIDINSTAPLPDLTGATPLRWDFQTGGPAKQIVINGFDVVDNGPLALGSEFLSFVGSELSLNTDLNTQGRNVEFLTVGANGGSLDFDLQAIPANAPEGTIEITGDIMTASITGSAGDILLFGGDVTVNGALDTGSTLQGTIPISQDIEIIANNLIHSGLITTEAGSVSGNIEIFAFDSASFTNSELATSGGEAPIEGFIRIQADVLDLNEFRLSTGTTGIRDASNIQIVGRDVSLATTTIDPIDTSSSGSGDAGRIVFSVAETLDFNGVTLNASNTGTGDGGLIVVLDFADLTFTADSSFAFDVSATAPFTENGRFIGRMPDIPSGPAPPTPPGDLPPPSETNDVIASLDQVISFTANETSPTVADDSLFGATDDFAAADSGESEGNVDDEDEELANTSGQSDQNGTLPAVGSDIASAEGAVAVASAEAPSTTEENAAVPAALLTALEEDQPEAAVAAAVATSTSKKGSSTIPGISLFTRAAERAPLMPRTCDVLAKTGGGSRLLARNPRRQPISSEDWLLAFDQSGDQLLAMSSQSLPSVGTEASADSAASNRQGEIQQAFAAAAIAIRGDRYEEAATRFTTAVDSLEQSGDDRGATQALMAFAQLQFEDGRFSGARETLERALALAIAAGDETNIAKARQSLGNALVGIGDLSGAEEELTRGLGVALAAKDKGPAASMLNDLGNRHAAKRDYKSALWAYERAANLAGELGRVGDEARALAGAARVAVDVSRLDDAWRLLERADSIRGDARSARARASLAIHVGRTFAELANVTNDKRADALLRSSAAFESAIQDAEASGDTYSLALANLNLGSLYKDEQHHSEALYLTRLARKDATRIGAPELIYRAHWQEGQILWSAHRVRDALASHRRAIAILEETKPVSSDGYGATEANFQRSVGGVYRDHVDLLLRSSELATSAAISGQLIAEARETLEKLKGAEIRDYFEDECIASVHEEKRTIEAGVAIVHTVMLPDRLELLVTLPTGIERFSTKISASNLMRMIDRFRTEVQNPRSTAYRPLARQLFDIIVAPYSGRLEEIGITTLIFVPDGRLRTLPFVALHDGVGFLGDRYATATTLSLNLLANRDLTTETGAPVLAGVSESVQGFVALESVDEELMQIQGLGGGQLLLNQAFTLDRVKSAVANEVPGILHLATHAVFTGNPDTSFLLTYGGRVGFDELADVVGMTRTEGAPLDLLVLSACETAVGNDRAGLGFTGSAIRAGARSAVGSLWPIADEAARQLMVEFYMNLQSSEVTKANALQQAQAHLRSGAQYAHPAYWAPFTLVNDWL